MEHQEFNTVEALQKSAIDLDCRFMMVEGSEPHWKVERARPGSCHLNIGRSATGLIVEGLSSKNASVFYAPLVPDTWRLNGKIVTKRSLMFMPPGSNFHAVSTVPTGWACIVVPSETLDLKELGDAKNDNEAIVIETTENYVRTLVQKEAALFKAISSCAHIENSKALIQGESEILSVLMEAVRLRCANEMRAQGRPKIDRSEMIDRVEDYLERHSHETVSLLDLTSFLGISERCLRGIFNEYFNMGPTKFLRLRQLHHVRQSLLNSHEGEKTVTEVLTDWGVWEFGRFAGRYRRCFGELPSETLKRPPFKEV